MAKKKTNDWKKREGMVYSTDADFSFQDTSEEEVEELSPAQQQLRIWLDTKSRAGKAVTVVKGFVGHELALKMLAKELKTACGVGGSTKDGEILIQGDHREKVIQVLVAAGYKAKKSGG
ncbi:MAG: translation initiation factor [Nitritalea sp.]